MKRFLAVLLAMMMLLGCFALADEAEKEAELQAEAEAETVVPAADGVLHMVDGTVFVDYEGFTITFKGENRISYSYLYCPVVVVNKSDRNIGVSLDDVSINDWEVYGGGLSGTNAGKKAKGELSFNVEDAEVAAIEEIEDIQLVVRLYDSDTYDTIWTSDVIHLLP